MNDRRQITVMPATRCGTAGEHGGRDDRVDAAAAGVGVAEAELAVDVAQAAGGLVSPVAPAFGPAVTWKVTGTSRKGLTLGRARW